jgi:hypothetical protein
MPETLPWNSGTSSTVSESMLKVQSPSPAGPCAKYSAPLTLWPADMYQVLPGSLVQSLAVDASSAPESVLSVASPAFAAEQVHSPEIASV